ncbi:MAG: P1 family peptidase [Anaerolineales bacterium]|jgi:L-aminopeptidase/D-esterase-like protein
MMADYFPFTSVPGLQVGQAQNQEALTGCTVVLCPKGAVAGVDQRGGAPGTREIALLDPTKMVQRVHAVLLAGGSAYGLNAAAGVMRYLEEQDIGYDVGVAKVPIVPAAILFDLAIGKSDVRPDEAMGYAACQSASGDPPGEGNAGAGTGATAGKILGMGGAVKSGIGHCAIDLGGGVWVGAIVAANPLGDIVDPATGAIIAGARPTKIGPITLGGPGPFADSLEIMRTAAGKLALRVSGRDNTVIGVVATNAELAKAEATKVAQMAQDGVSRAVRPAHTQYDGDTLFALSTGSKKADLNLVGAYAAEAVAQAIVRAARQAQSAGGLPSATEIKAD